MADRIVILTGGIGCGKSVAAKEFEALGVQVVDADAISHELTAAGGAAMGAISEAFGNEVLTEAGSLDRTAMREAIFRDPDKRARLEAILHPLVRDQAKLALAAAPGPYAVYMVPLWLEKYGPNARPTQAAGIKPQAIIVIDCSEETQIRRVRARSGLSQNEVQAIMSTQVPRAERRACGDYVIDNEGPEKLLKEKIAAIHRSLTTN